MSPTKAGAGVKVAGHSRASATRISAGQSAAWSIAMGAIGSDIAINSASIALMTNDLRRIPLLIVLSRKSASVINQNLAFGMLFSVAFGLEDMGVVVLGDMPAGFPSLVFPHITGYGVFVMVGGAFSIAITISIESLLTLNTFCLLWPTIHSLPPSTFTI